jgi:hypothetical protein
MLVTKYLLGEDEHTVIKWDFFYAGFQVYLDPDETGVDMNNFQFGIFQQSEVENTQEG